jgi:hypothetical protein
MSLGAGASASGAGGMDGAVAAGGGAARGGRGARGGAGSAAGRPPWRGRVADLLRRLRHRLIYRPERRCMRRRAEG